MSDIGEWKKIKKSGAFRRRLKIIFENMMCSVNQNSVSGVDNDKTVQVNRTFESTNSINSASNQNFYGSTFANINIISILETEKQRLVCDENSLLAVPVDQLNDGEITDDEVRNNWLLELESNDEDNFVVNVHKNTEFRKNIRQWSVSFNIPQLALKVLLQNINARFPNVLPQDPRTLLKTYQKIVMVKVGDYGGYWHHGFEFCLRQVLTPMHFLPKTISLNVNMDGLPIYKSSKSEFWPILFNIYELPEVRPMIIGIYCGKGKPSNVAEYLGPFVEEAKLILSEGLIISGNRIAVKLRCFVCDSPARAFIKGVTNFNSKQGCLKCTTVGEYSYISHTVYFPRAGCEKRTDEGFRAKLYGSHHKHDTPLTLLPIDMIEDFPVGDSLHLSDLGIMKKCLLGWRDGSSGTYKTKWSARDINIVSNFLENCKLPSEIHRSVRGLDVLCFWKASEYHTFLQYLSIVILKDVLHLDVYQHFLMFFALQQYVHPNFMCIFLIWLKH